MKLLVDAGWRSQSPRSKWWFPPFTYVGPAFTTREASDVLVAMQAPIRALREKPRPIRPFKMLDKFGKTTGSKRKCTVPICVASGHILTTCEGAP